MRQLADSENYDVVVIGAGFSGLYMLHRQLRRNARVVCLEAGDGVGGTWYWNRYPGARVDIESMQYSYSFDDDLQQEWEWPELFSAQPDLEAYANHVADRHGLREHIRFGARVDRLRYDDDRSRWQVRTERGDRIVAKYVVAATGGLDATNVPDFPGLASFEGEWHHTSKWPKERVSFAGRRVGVIGTGSSGVQAIPVIAEAAEHLTVFQRTPAFSMPSGNRLMDRDYEHEWKSEYPERRRAMLATEAAGLVPPPKLAILDLDPAEQQRALEEAWASRSGVLFLRTFTDVRSDPRANEIVAEFVRDKIRSIVRDPEVAERLCPKTYPIGAKRICMDTGYYDTFNRDDVTLVDVRADPIEEILPHGLRTRDATYELDILVLATGFDAVTGSMLRMNVTGVGGLDLQEKWRDGPTSFLGFLVAGFPNLFMIHGPGGPGVLAQMITSGEWQVDFVSGFIEGMEAAGHTSVRTTEEWERSWRAEVDAAAANTLFTQADTWHTGANIPGKPKVFMIYLGGFDRWVQRCTRQLASGEGFVYSDATVSR